MPLVDVFARQTLIFGQMYPAGAKVPADVWRARTLAVRRSSGVVHSVEDHGQDFPEPFDPPTPPAEPVASRVAVELAEAAVADLRERLSAATTELERLQSRTIRVERGESEDVVGDGVVVRSPLDDDDDEDDLAEQRAAASRSRTHRILGGVGTHAGDTVEVPLPADIVVGTPRSAKPAPQGPLPEHLR